MISHEKLISQIRMCDKYLEWKKAIIERCKSICDCCQIRIDGAGSSLQIHHKISILEIIECYKITNLNEALECKALWDINNGTVLCNCCHIDVHCKKFKLGGNNDR